MSHVCTNVNEDVPRHEELQPRHTMTIEERREWGTMNKTEHQPTVTNGSSKPSATNTKAFQKQFRVNKGGFRAGLRVWSHLQKSLRTDTVQIVHECDPLL